jgi:hypothetical protein
MQLLAQEHFFTCQDGLCFLVSLRSTRRVFTLRATAVGYFTASMGKWLPALQRRGAISQNGHLNGTGAKAYNIA